VTYPVDANSLSGLTDWAFSLAYPEFPTYFITWLDTARPSLEFWSDQKVYNHNECEYLQAAAQSLPLMLMRCAA
jgi:hypothetical protein